MGNFQHTNVVSITKDRVIFQLQQMQNFDWLQELGEVFCVFDQQDSGNVSFGVQRDKQKYFVKYAGAKPVHFTGNPSEAIQSLINAVPVYQALEHPHVIKLVNHFPTEKGYALVFEWFEGECLHSHWTFGGKAKYTNPKSPFYRFKQLDVEKRLHVLDAILSFHAYVESQNYVAVDLYDGSILYDFHNDKLKLCDIDFYRMAPAINDIGKDFWGSTRLKSPEEYELGAPIDSKTNVFTLGAMAFVLLGGELDRSLSKWDAGHELYEVALKAVEENRENRYGTVKEFYNAWNEASNSMNPTK
ncbi:protein kinase domain-containing protein [Alkalihalobacterium alkalicellulosilyticum]|uniref:protein kinase domain-containing protein n=1 Tax=Alkalihalobacterium alkalicellulosilyticum TaxID=1912214 RepID=UPI000997C8CC|nr:serine/threonine protein kinase [Bacillus alkalicellulosilyticus]